MKLKKKKRKIFLLIIAVFILLYIIYFNSPNVIYLGKNNITLANHAYSWNHSSYGNVYLIDYNKPLTKFTLYTFDKNTNIEINISKNHEFILSLSTFSSPFNWKIDSTSSDGIIKFEHYDSVEPVSFKLDSALKGESNNRENFLFKALSSGTEKIHFQYKNSERTQNDLYITINVK